MTLIPKISLGRDVQPDVKRAIQLIIDSINGALNPNALLASIASASGFGEVVGGVVTPPTGDLTTPDKPLNFEVHELFSSILLRWDRSAFSAYAYTEVWRAKKDPDVAAAPTIEEIKTNDNPTGDDDYRAFRVGTTIANVWTDTPPEASTTVYYYYWVRFVSTANIAGPWNASEGTIAHTIIDPSILLEQLFNRLGYDQFDSSAGIFPVRVVDELPDLPDAVNWPIGSIAYLLSDAKLYRIEEVGDEQRWTAAVEAPDVVGKLVAGQIAAGAIIAEHIGANQIIANEANIVTGIIKDAHIGTVGADKLFAKEGTIASVLIGSADITNAMIANVIQSADNGLSWRIDKNGWITARRIAIYDPDGTQLLVSGGYLDFARISGTTKPANNATVGARVGTNITRPDGSLATTADFVASWNKMTMYNISTYIAGAAIQNAQIGAAAIWEANINTAAVSTLKIKNNAVVVPTYSKTLVDVRVSSFISSTVYWTTVHQHIVAETYNQPILLLLDYENASWVVSGPDAVGRWSNLWIRVLLDNNEVYIKLIQHYETGSEGDDSASRTYTMPAMMYMINPVAYNANVTLQIGISSNYGATATAPAGMQMVSLCVKR